MAIRRDLRFIFWIFLGFGIPCGLLLYSLPGHTDGYWAWAISSPLSAILIGAGFLGMGLYFALALKDNNWLQIQNGIGGFVMFFAVLLVSTVVDWQQFRAYRLATLIWIGLCCCGTLVMPVLYRVQRVDSADQNSKGNYSANLSKPIRAILAIRGFVYLSLAILWLAQADILILAWPWKINPLELRVFTAQLGIVGWNAIVVLSGRFTWNQMRMGMLLGGVIGLLQLLGFLVNAATYSFSGLGIFLQLMFLEWFVAALLMFVLYERKKVAVPLDIRSNDYLH
jgi:hypothetical protein